MNAQVRIPGSELNFQFSLRHVLLLISLACCCLALASQGHVGDALLLLLVPLIFFGTLLGIRGIAFVLNLLPIRVLRVSAMTTLCGIGLSGSLYAGLVWNVQRSEKRAVEWVVRQGGSVDRNWWGAVFRVRLPSEAKGLSPLLKLRDLRVVEVWPSNGWSTHLPDRSRFERTLPQCRILFDDEAILFDEAVRAPPWP